MKRPRLEVKWPTTKLLARLTIDIENIQIAPATIIVVPEARPFIPSIKFKALVSATRQNMVNRALTNVSDSGIQDWQSHALDQTSLYPDKCTCHTDAMIKRIWFDRVV